MIAMALQSILNRFQTPEPSLLDLMARAYAYIAWADGDSSHAELAIFISILRDDPDFPDVDAATAAEVYARELALVKETAPEALLESFSSRMIAPVVARRILLLAQRAIAADHKVTAQEEHNIARLALALGLNPRDA